MCATGIRWRSPTRHCCANHQSPVGWRSKRTRSSCATTCCAKLEEWNSGGRHADALVRRGARLDSAVDLLGKSDFAAAMAPAAEYLAASQKLAAAGRRRARLVQAVIYTLFLCIIAGLIGFINQAFLREQYQWRIVMRPSVLTAEQEKEKAAKPGSDFKECANGCPTMIVVPAGKFTMGSPESEKRSQ